MYRSEYLTVTQRGDTLVQQWSPTPLSGSQFQHEMSAFMDLATAVQPGALLWDIAQCNLAITAELAQWMGAHVLSPLHAKGLRQMALTIADDQAVHMSIAESLHRARAIIRPIYFSSRAQAEHFVDGGDQVVATEKEPVSCHHDPSSRRFELGVSVSLDELGGALASLKRLAFEREFVANHQCRFDSLTCREHQVFALLARGLSNCEMAGALFIEESSIKTHRKNIKRKLRIRSHFDIFQYARCFSVIE